jgi:hypothetical protein
LGEPAVEILRLGLRVEGLGVSVESLGEPAVEILHLGIGG